MSVAVIFEAKIKSGQTEEFVRLLAQALPVTREKDGCRGVTVYRDSADPDTVVMIEDWDDADSHRNYMEWRKQQGDSARAADFYATPPRITYLTAADA